jgi:hypothetical protein
VFYLFYVLIKLMWFLMVATVWLVVAAVVIPIALFCTATSNRRAARDLMRVLDWSRMLL